MTPDHPRPEPAPPVAARRRAAEGRRERPFFRRVEHPPFDPPRTNPTPDGWVAEPVGRWDGHETEVVYDPRRYTVMLVTGIRADAGLEGGLEASGWERRAQDGSCTLWIRDKLAAIRAALTRLDDSAAAIGVDAAPDAGGGRQTPIAAAVVARSRSPAPGTAPERPAALESPAR